MSAGQYKRTKYSPPSAETRAKLSEGNRRRRLSPETRAKISAALQGKTSNFAGKRHSPDTRQKMREAHQKRRAEG